MCQDCLQLTMAVWVRAQERKQREHISTCERGGGGCSADIAGRLGRTGAAVAERLGRAQRQPAPARATRVRTSGCTRC